MIVLLWSREDRPSVAAVVNTAIRQWLLAITLSLKADNVLRV